jgi:hypothetical protein
MFHLSVTSIQTAQLLALIRVCPMANGQNFPFAMTPDVLLESIIQLPQLGNPMILNFFRYYYCQWAYNFCLLYVIHFPTEIIIIYSPAHSNEINNITLGSNRDFKAAQHGANIDLSIFFPLSLQTHIYSWPMLLSIKEVFHNLK